MTTADWNNLARCARKRAELQCKPDSCLMAWPSRAHMERYRRERLSEVWLMAQPAQRRLVA